MVLLLFDIDGTLVQRASAEHAAAVQAALRDVYGVADAGRPRTSTPPAGPTSRSRGAPAAQRRRRADDRRRAWATSAPPPRRTTRAWCPTTSAPRACRASGALLESLAARGDRRLSLVTGNLEPIARLKLRAAGLGRFFPRGQGGFGSDHEDRTELPAIARARAGGARPSRGPASRRCSSATRRATSPAPGPTACAASR